MLIGQDRAGKTSLKKSLIGLPFDPKENSTQGIEVDPSIFHVDAHEVKNWQPIDKSKRGLLGCSKDVAQMVVEKLCILDRYNWFWEEEKSADKRDSDQLANENNKNGKKAGNTDDEKGDASFLNQVCLGPFKSSHLYCSYQLLLAIIIMKHLIVIRTQCQRLKEII